MTFDLSQSSISRADAEMFLSVQMIAKRAICLEEVIAHRPSLTIGSARDFLDRCSAAGLLTWNDRGDFFDLADAGYSLVASGLKPRIDNKAAAKALEKAIAKARLWNQDKSVPVAIAELRLFGSFLHEKPDYGDVDIEIVFADRVLPEARFNELSESVPMSARRDYTYHIRPDLVVVERMIRKARLSIERAATSLAVAYHGTIERLGADWRQVYAFDVGAETEITADTAYHPRSKPREEPEVLKHETSPAFMFPLVNSSVRTDQRIWASTIAQLADGFWWGNRSRNGSRTPAVPVNNKEEALLASCRAIDEVRALDIGAASPFEAIRAIQSYGIELGQLVPGHVVIDLRHDGATLMLPMTDIETGSRVEERDLVIQVLIEGKKRDVALTPAIRFLGLGVQLGEKDSFTDCPELVTMARTAADPLFEMLDRLKVASGAALALTLYWDPRTDPEPVLPSLGSLMRHVAKSAREFSVRKDALTALRASLRDSDMTWNSICLEQEVTLEVRGAAQSFDDDGSEPDEEMIYVNQSSSATAGWDDEEIALHPKVPEEQHRAIAHKALPALRGLGDSWVLDISRKARKFIHPKETSVESVIEALEKEGVAIL